MQLTSIRYGKRPLYIGAFCILVALGLEYAFQPFRGSEEHPATFLIFSLNTLVLWVAEVGYAFVIAWVVSWFIEQRSHAAHMSSLQTVRDKIESDVSGHLAQLKDANEAVSKNVFAATFGMAYEPDYVRAVINSALTAKIIREDYEISYRLERFTEAAAAKYKVDRNRFVMLHSTTRYFARNIATSDEELRVRYGLPLRRGAVRDATRLVALTVGDKTYTKAEISSIETYDDGADERDYLIRAPLSPGKGVLVIAKAEIVKEMSDTEVFGFRDPTTRLTLRLNVNIEGLRFGSTARCASPMKVIGQPDSHGAEWRIEGSLLPHNSVTIWWRSAADDGENSQGEPEDSGNVNLPRDNPIPKPRRPRKPTARGEQNAGTL